MTACLGAQLARLEARVMFEVLLGTYPTIELTGDVTRLRATMVPGVASDVAVELTVTAVSTCVTTIPFCPVTLSGGLRFDYNGWGKDAKGLWRTIDWYRTEVSVH